ncbi:MAG: hypothetical protein IJG84_15605, partial [Kiritimatiellae bacterium]|nr:hypothetical protein [Kiritimatiellia bacterium]
RLGEYGIILSFSRWDGIGWVVGADIPSWQGRACARAHNPTQLGKLYSYVINATGTDSVIVETSTSRTADLFNTIGERTGTIRIESGVSRIHVPVSGYARLDPKVVSSVQD